MRIVSLLFHDVIQSQKSESSGFSGPAARRYKLEKAAFLLQLAELHKAVPYQPITDPDSVGPTQPRDPFMLTFDDGGISAHTHVSSALDQYGWKAHFFVVTDWIGRPGFLNAGQIRDLRKRGHTIGTHSRSHPEKLWSMKPSEIHDEWAQSIARLSDILGEPVVSASVPGGYYSKTVAEMAAIAGVEVLFTSEPVRFSWKVRNCMVIGRYLVHSGLDPRAGVALVRRQRLPALKAYLSWNTRKIVKTVCGNLYSRARFFLLDRTCS